MSIKINRVIKMLIYDNVENLLIEGSLTKSYFENLENFMVMAWLVIL